VLFSNWHSAIFLANTAWMKIEKHHRFCVASLSCIFWSHVWSPRQTSLGLLIRFAKPVLNAYDIGQIEKGRV